MPSTYTLNNGIELIATGEQSGTWGDTTNTNFNLVDTALDGQVTITLASAGTSGSPNTLAISDGAASDGRNRLVIYTDGGDLGATAYVQLTPNDAEKIVYIRNNLSGSRSIIVFQGTYNASNDYEIPAGTTAVIFFNGGGAGAVAANVFNNAYFDGLRLGAVSVTAILDEDNMASDSATALATQQSIKAYVDAQVAANNELSEVLANGNTSGGNNIQMTTTDEVQFRDTALKISSSADGQLDIDADVEVEIVAPTLDIDASTAVTIDTATLTMTGSVNVVGDLDVDNLNLNGNSIISTNANGNIALTPNGTGEVDISKVDIDGGTIDGTVIGGSTPAAISGTTGSFSGNLTVDTNTLFVNATNNRVGVGTTSPNAQLHSVGADGVSLIGASGATQGVRIGVTTANGGYIEGVNNTLGLSYEPLTVGGSLVRFTTSNTERMRITSTGNVGIGITSANAKLHIATADSGANVSTGADELFLEGSGDSGITIGSGSSSIGRISFADSGTDRIGALDYSHSDNSMRFSTGNGTERMRIDSSGNVGIGTTSPAVQLHIKGNDGFLIEDDGTTNYLRIQTSNAGDGVFYTGSIGGAVTERLRITSSGNVGIGTSSPVANNAGAKTLQIDGAGFSVDIRLTNVATGATAANGSAVVLDSTNFYLWNYENAFTAFGTNNTERMRIDASGNVGIGTSSPSEKLSVTGNVTISGSLSKGSGSFKIDHPVKPDTHHLVHSFIEGPQADNLYRGKVALLNGFATINLDEAGRMTEGTFVALNGNVQCFTTNEAGWTQVRGRVDGNILTIEAQDPACTDEVSWLVIGERHDAHMIDANWTDNQGRVITEPEK